MSLSISSSNPLLSHSHPRTDFPTSLLISSLTPSKLRPKTVILSINASNSPSLPSPVRKPTTTPSPSFRTKPPGDINILVAGSTGYIGKFVVREICRRGFNVISVARERSGIRGRNDRDQALQQLSGSTVCFSDVTDLDALDRSLDFLSLPIDAVLPATPAASRSRRGEGSSTVCFSDVTDLDALDRSLDSLDLSIDAIVCCLASCTGGISESGPEPGRKEELVLEEEGREGTEGWV